MHIRYAGIIVISLLILLGIAILLPVYYQERPYPIVMLSFDIIKNDNVLEWCNDLSSILHKYNIKATVFFTGKIAQIYPKCVSLFSSNNNVDVGSSTYNYSNLVSISDYSKALEEVKSGKSTIDNIGQINSKIFRAPYGATDDNIYSLLTQTGILADFSYKGQYNKYENGQFIKYDLIAYNGSLSQLSEIINSISSKKPTLITFDNSISVSQLDSFISNINSNIKDVYFTNASELTDISLTLRR